jgi:hypothetical protein
MNPGGKRGGKAIAPSGLKAPLAHLFRTGERLKGHAFPESAIAASALRRGNEGYGLNQRANIARALAEIKRQYPGLLVVKKSGGGNIAHVTTSSNRMTGQIIGQKLVINTAAPFWKNPKGEAIRMRRSGFSASASPGHIVRHELGHIVHPPTRALRYSSTPGNAGRVSRYSRTDAAEFMAETYGGLKSGQRYPARVMAEYRRLQAATKPSGARNMPRARRINPVPLKQSN